MADISKITLNGTDYNVKDANAQETLVSGTNIKTINNESILGSGNITIQGGSGGGETVIELTQAQYDALSAYAPDTTYIITDATPIDMDDYATTADTAAIEADVATLSGSVANKADKANVSANSARIFPRWNSQGIITGTTGSNMYEVTHNINGSSYTIVRAGTSGSLPSIFAPTVSGATGSVLLSAGNTAPSWSSYKFQFITQTEYDALSTKDSTTIYFIVGD
jgi:hypothetical protein